jgi:hypothetical protein
MAFTVQSSKLPIWGKRRGRLSLIFQCGVQEDKGIAAIEFALFLPLLLILLLGIIDLPVEKVLVPALF